MDLFKENPEETVLGFCVLGEYFPEGIDLKNDRLIGAVIVGVGLPQICPERVLSGIILRTLKEPGLNTLICIRE